LSTPIKQSAIAVVAAVGIFWRTLIAATSLSLNEVRVSLDEAGMQDFAMSKTWGDDIICKRPDVVAELRKRTPGAHVHISLALPPEPAPDMLIQQRRFIEAFGRRGTAD
jgi:hypothetical protein